MYITFSWMVIYRLFPPSSQQLNDVTRLQALSVDKTYAKGYTQHTYTHNQYLIPGVNFGWRRLPELVRPLSIDGHLVNGQGDRREDEYLKTRAAS